MARVETPNARTIEAVTQFLDVPATRCIKTILVKAREDAPAEAVALMLRGDHDINMLKEADTGILFCPPENVVAEFPEFTVTRNYGDLKTAIEQALA